MQDPDESSSPEPVDDPGVPPVEGADHRAPGTGGGRRRAIVAGLVGAIVVGAGVAVGLLVSGGSDHAATVRPAPSAAGSSRDRSSGGTVESPAPGVTLDPADARLLASLRPFAVTDCRAAPRDGNGVAAALTCAPGVATEAPAPARLSVLQYQDAAALRGDVERRSGELTDAGDCARGQTSVERWAHSARRRGTFLCTAGASRFSVYWTVEDELVGFATEDPDAGRLLAWWREYDPI
ncbi:hypothetical protein ND748_04210 [Frankia sp. AiPs1]|uniref:hypothetical protein n=1 Tax=Frankia sp. AiPs1 TaxID=573493 RepID=UPI002043590F|nr:hypothetical protein [Frankia sp. AiPs1]MCM3920883.1 hypothetical protein [Frankia sp. AiPs1]